MKEESAYKLRKRIKELECDLKRASNDLYLYRAVTRKIYDWLADFAKKETTGSPNPKYGLDLMKELFK